MQTLEKKEPIIFYSINSLKTKKTIKLHIFCEVCIFVTACCNHRNEQWLRLLRWSRCVSLHHSISESIRLKQKPKKLLVISTCSVQIMHRGSDEKTHFSLLMDYCLVFICIWAAVLLCPPAGVSSPDDFLFLSPLFTWDLRLRHKQVWAKSNLIYNITASRFCLEPKKKQTRLNEELMTVVTATAFVNYLFIKKTCLPENTTSSMRKETTSYYAVRFTCSQVWCVWGSVLF